MPLRIIDGLSRLNGFHPAMHTDRKIGFAMGILLIGIVAALFFRNEPLIDTRIPTVRRERELNERLRERDVAVYISEDKKNGDTHDEADSDPPWTLRDVLRKMDERNKALPSPVGPSRGVPHSDRNIERKEVAESQDVAPVTEDTGESDPRRLAPATPEKGALPPLMPAVEPVASKEPAEPVIETGPVFQLPESFDEYVVKYGDTLSGIAQRLLGSQACYQEIYEANRDRMASPDRLDVGKPIRIPRIASKGL